MLDTGGTHAVTTGDIPSPEGVQVHPNGKCRSALVWVPVSADEGTERYLIADFGLKVVFFELEDI